MKKKDDQIINSLYEKLKIFKEEGLIITKKEVQDFFLFTCQKELSIFLMEE